MERPDSLDTSDVDGAQTRPLPVRRTVHPFNTNHDIQGSTPFRFSQGRFEASSRCIDTLTPDYKLPSYAVHPLPPTSAPRDVLWTVPQRKWRPEPRAEKNWTDDEKFGRSHLFQAKVPTRPALEVADITGPQFRFEEQRWRQTDPLQPVYFYDGAEIDRVRTRRPHYGSQFTRTAEENFALRTDDILTEKIFNREYPKALIKTRVANRTDDITGAQADTRCSAPKLWKIKDPMETPQKLTNRVMDIDGAIAGTGGQGAPLYRTRKQAAAIAAAADASSMYASSMYASSMPRSTMPPPATAAPAASFMASSRAADIASVRALP